MPSVSGQDRQFGRLALRQGGVTPDQLAECLAEQQAAAAQGAAAPRLGALLLRKGYLTDAALAELLAAPDGNSDADHPPQSAATADDSRFARRLEAHGLATPEEVADTLRVQQVLSENGIPLRLHELLVARGVLTATQVRTALATVRPTPNPHAAPPPAPPPAPLPPPPTLAPPPPTAPESAPTLRMPPAPAAPTAATLRLSPGVAATPDNASPPPSDAGPPPTLRMPSTSAPSAPTAATCHGRWGNSGGGR